MSRGQYIAAILSAIGVFYVLWSIPRDRPPTIEVVERTFVQETTEDLAPLRFSDVTEAMGVSWTHSQGGEKLEGLDETYGSGLCLLDANNDGWVDVLLVGGSGQTRFYQEREWWTVSGGHALYINRGGTSFEDASDQLGLTEDVWGIGCHVADLDNDGDQDVVLANLGPNILLENVEGSFNATPLDTEETRRWTSNFLALDVNGDGRLDLYEANYVRFNKGARLFEGVAAFRSQEEARYRPHLYDSEPNRVLLQTDNMVFEEADAGELAEASSRSTSAILLKGTPQQPEELLVTSDEAAPDALFVNEAGRWARVDDARGLGRTDATKNAAQLDVNQDGYPDIVMAGARGVGARLFMYSPETGRYKEESELYGLRLSQMANANTNSVAVGDPNLDGRADLLMFNGLFHPDRLAHRLPEGQGDALFLRRANDLFLRADVPDLQHHLPSRSGTFVDLDNDGDEDIILTQNNGSARILRNDIENAREWYGIDLIGTGQVVVETNQRKLVLAPRTESNFLGSGPWRQRIYLNPDERITKAALKRTGGRDLPITLTAGQYVLIRGEAVRKMPQTELATLPADMPQDAYDLTLKLLQADEPLVRAATFDMLEQHQSAQTIAWALEGLKDPSPIVRAAAVKLLKAQEIEATVPMLIRLAETGTTDDVCAVTDTFAHFYIEEEAVLLRKYLAVTTFIKRLEHAKDPREVACLAHALGEAEHFEALVPMMAAFDRVTTAEERASVILSIGNIRAPEAVPFLEKIALDAQYDQATRAATLVAISQIFGSEAGQTVPPLWRIAQTDPVGFIRRLELIARDEDWRIFMRPEVMASLIRRLRNHTDISGSASLMAALDEVETAFSRDQVSQLERLESASETGVVNDCCSDISAFSSITRGQLTEMPGVVAAAILSDDPERLTAAAQLVISRSEPWAFQVTRDAVFDPSTEDHVTEMFSDLLAERATGRYEFLLARLSALRHRKQADAAMGRLIGLPGAAARHVEFLERVYNNPEEKAESRAIAAHGLLIAAWGNQTDDEAG